MAVKFQGGKAVPINQITNEEQQRARDEAIQACARIRDMAVKEGERLQRLGLIYVGNEMMGVAGTSNNTRRKLEQLK